MNCAACPITVKTVLRKQPGVEDVKVDAQKHTAEVKFDSATVSAEKLAQVVTEAGYPTTARK
jgi:mercuric ion binding protein